MSNGSNAPAVENAEKELQQFLYLISHDLKEPMRMVSSFTKLLQKKLSGTLDAQSDEYLRFVQTGVSRMEAMTADLLTYSRLTTYENSKEILSLDAVVEGVTAQLQKEIENVGGTITVEKLGSLSANRPRMNRLFHSLLSNAIKFHGSEALKITVRAVDEGEFKKISVSDNGIGIDPKHHERIFQPFKKLNASDDFPGTGMGLAIAQKIVQQHGGKMWVESALGEGATFHITLPN